MKSDAYPSLSNYWGALFGERVWRISVDAGLGCPHRDSAGGGCAFCEPASFVPTLGASRSVGDQLRRGMADLQRKKVNRFAAYFQPGTNTNAPVETLKKLWDEAAEIDEVVALCVGTRPDCVGEPVLELLASYRNRFDIWLELGLQSASDLTLDRINRGHDTAAFSDAVTRARGRGLKVCAHVILGLPGEGVEEEARTAALLTSLGVEGVKVHQLSVIKGTPMEALYERGEVVPPGEEEYIARALAFLRRLPPSTVVHRLVGDTMGEGLVSPSFDKRRVFYIIREELGL